MNLDLNVLQNNETNFINSFVNQWNRISVTTGKGIVINKNEINADNIKSFIGDTALNGQNLPDVTHRRLGMIVRKAGVFTEIGDYAEDSTTDIKFTNLRANGSLIATTNGTAFNNEISQFDTVTLTLARQAAEISGYGAILARTTTQDELLKVATMVLQNQKKLRFDQMAAVELTTNPAIANIDTTTPPTTAPIHTYLKTMIGNLSGTVDGVSEHVFVTSPQGVARLFQEKTTTGEFVAKDNNTSFTPRLVDGIRQSVGYVGDFDGYKVYATNGILATYTTNASGAVTAQTGGTRTIFGFGLPFQLKLGSSLLQNDTVSIFDEKNTYSNFKDGSMQIGLSFLGAVRVCSPSTWQYVTV